MLIILVSVLVLVFIGFLLLGYISPYDGDINTLSFDITDDKISFDNIIDNKNIVEKSNEEQIVRSPWRNIGLELYNELNLDRFVEKLNFMIGKKILIVTDSSYVLGANFKDHKKYEGTLTRYEILEGRYPDQPSLKLIVNVPVLSTTTVNLNWIYDKYRFDSDFSSHELVEEFLKTGELKNELLLVER